MNNLHRKIDMYILSLALLFVFLIIITIDIPKLGFDVVDMQAWKDIGIPNILVHIKDFTIWKEIIMSNVVTIISVLMLMYSYYAYKRFEFDIEGASEIPFKITKIESINYEHLTFLATYIVPLISFDFESTRQMLVLGLLLIIMGVIYIKTDLFYANPSLSLFGFHIYKINGTFKVGDRDDVVVISRNKLKNGNHLQYIRLDDRIYYVKGVK